MAKQPIFEIINIPQDIKLELNNGTLTLKSGSVITYADGTQVQTTSDKTVTYSSNGKRYVYINLNSNNLVVGSALSETCSGTTDTLAGTAWHMWYDTTNKVINRYGSNGTTLNNTCSLPLAIVTVSSGAISSIDKVFNGFGYIGSSIFILPDVEGFYPNGKDGFNNLFNYQKITSLIVRTFTNGISDKIIGFTETGIEYFDSDLEVVEKRPALGQMVVDKQYYSKFDNKVFSSDGFNISETESVFFGYITTDNSTYRITDLKISNPFLVEDIYEYENARSLPLSQYANSIKYMALFNNLSYVFNNSRTLEDWFNVVYNLKTAYGYGLDIWGIILNKDRQFYYEENGTIKYIYLGGEQTIDGKTYSASYMEEMYRMVLFLKVLCCITNCTLASLNSLLQFYFNQRVYVINYGTMEIRYVFEFYVSNLEKAIFSTEFLPRPTGVLANFEYLPQGGYFGFFVDGINDPTEQSFAPFDNKPFYR